MVKGILYKTFPPPPSDAEEEQSPDIPGQGDSAEPSQQDSSSTGQPQPSGGCEAMEHSSEPLAQTGVTNPALVDPSTDATGRSSEPRTGVANPAQEGLSTEVREHLPEPLVQAGETNAALADSSAEATALSPEPQTGITSPAPAEPSTGPTQSTAETGMQTNASQGGRPNRTTAAPRLVASGIAEPTDGPVPETQSEEPRGRTRHRGEQPRRFPSPPVEDPNVAVVGKQGGILPTPVAGEEPAALRAILPNYVHPREIHSVQLPPCAAFREAHNVIAPDFESFLQKVLDDAFAAIARRVPSTEPDDIYPRPRRSPGCKAKCYFSHRRIIRDPDPAWANELREQQGEFSRDQEEDWFGRRSVHKNKRTCGNASFEEIREYWKNRHTAHLPEYVPGIQVTNIHRYNCEGVQLVNWRDVTAEICWIERRSGLCSSQRLFPVMVITAARAYNPALEGRPDAQLPTYEETADPRRPRQTYADVPPEGSPGHPGNGNNTSTEPTSSRVSQHGSVEAESSRSFRTAPTGTGSSRGVLSTPTEARSSRGLQDTPASARNSRDVNSPQTTLAEAGSSRDVLSTPTETGSSRRLLGTPASAGRSRNANPLQTTPAEPGSSRDVQVVPDEAGNSDNAGQPAEARRLRDMQPPEARPDPQNPSRGVPEGWLDSLFVVHLPVRHQCIPRQPRAHRVKRTLFPLYASVGMVKDLGMERGKDRGTFEWLMTVSAKPQSRLLFPRWLTNLYIGMPHLIKDEPGEFMKMLTWRRINPRIPRTKSLIGW
ncbi:hypothetical protein MGYG_04836 [Nannizzia gypsea CBS 118893]|uniref:DUF3074 domain-containing protein n=1 Tax=Arthroderma gypseum (strain ATCC MYA-4604 / CBS 118893) TaxID=535722 RepID=E4UX37_ARTGP|nr:hypothetical protein MGYG_04836 [Nannizzia gypsea CBS 118893]EFR01837.1 hypothetical protein MGYG_04836 [Nannizzia gypsea CBS 118893]